jgi:predicted transcriptional regulator
MSERITVRLDDELYGWLMDAAKARRMDISSVVRQAVSASVAGARTSALPSVPPHTPEDCLAVVLSQASLRTQRRLAETFTRIDGLLKNQGRSRLWFVAETLAHWTERAEQRVHEASRRALQGDRGVRTADEACR